MVPDSWLITLCDFLTLLICELLYLILLTIFPQNPEGLKVSKF